MLANIEIIRQVLASASRAKLPRAEEAMDVLADVNAAVTAINELEGTMDKEARDMEAGKVAHG